MDRNEIIKAAPYFNDITFRHLSKALIEYESKSTTAFMIMAAVFTESLLKDIYSTLAFDHVDGELNTLINHLKSEAKKNNTVGNDDRIRLINIGGRCDEIRQKRNRFVHDTGIPREESNIEVADVYNNISFIIEKYLETAVAQQIFASKRSCVTKPIDSLTNSDFRIFISTITPHNVEQTVFLNGIDDELRKRQIEPIRCKFDDYDKKDPIEKVRSTIENCDAFLVIGLERSHSYMYRDREFSEKQTDGIHRKHTSGWLHLESGLAVAMKKPVFVICQNDIYSDGIFDRDWNSYSVVEVFTPLNVYSEKTQLALQKIKEYADAHRR